MERRRYWVLGASDPEMESIEHLLREAGETVVYATVGGRRVSPGDAYRCDPVMGATHWVECAPVKGRPAGAVVIDHHRPGDPGYGRPPKDYWAASSLGQVWAALGWAASEPGPDLRMVAAADHCLAAAYRCECPGVDPEALMRWRAESRAAFQRRPVEAVLADVERARERLRTAPCICLACGNRRQDIDDPDCDCNRGPSPYGPGWGSIVADLRGKEVPELPEAAARDGIPFLGTPRPGPDGRKKVVLQAATQKQVELFMKSWGPREGLLDIYGDPARGFAGGYLSEGNHGHGPGSGGPRCASLE